MRDMKDSGISSIGSIPCSWTIRKFKTLAKLCNGKEITSDEGSIPVYGSGGVFKWTDSPIHSGESLLMGRKGTIDNPMLVNGEFWTVDTMFYTSDFYDVNSKFLFYCCKGAIDYGFYKSGSVLPSMTQTEINNIFIPYTSITEQEKIANILDEKCAQVDALISNVQSQIEKLKAYKQSVITEIVTKGLDPSVPMRDSGVAWIGNIPKQWNTIRVKQLLRERKERSKDGSEEPLSMSQKLGLVPTSMLDTIPNMASSFVGAKLTYVDDLVFNKLKAHLGVFSVSKYDGLVSPDYAVYYSTGKVHLKYLEYLFKTPQCISEFRKRSTGIAAGLTRLYTDGLFAIECPFPPMPEQVAIVDYLNEKCSQIDRLIAIKQAKIEKLEQYKKSLIYEYVTGKKEVS